MSIVNELRVLTSQSGKFHTAAVDIAASLDDELHKLHPLCRTRRTVRAKAIKKVLNQHESILTPLEDMLNSKAIEATRASGLLSKFLQPNT